MVHNCKETTASHNIAPGLIKSSMTKDLGFCLTDFEQAQVLAIKDNSP